ncbi:TniQ family protein [Metabacillus litoralis]|uniref:TniQ family protein n=1 Tax=Metabacillus litoralis TaxID=152268 RepID=UPI000EF5E75F|nr:TniQ family protein [Metabacillus litoralis]
MERSTLYNLEPLNLNNAYIESIGSYVERIAVLHNITTGTLLSKIISPILDKKYINNINLKGGDGFYKGSNAIAGFGTTANDFRNAMEVLTTRGDLVKTTLINQGPMLTFRGLLRNKKAWCPECLETMVEVDKEEVYFPLLWNIELFSICPKHRIKLEDKCRNCNGEMNILSRTSIPGYCSRCLNWLGSKAKIEGLDTIYNPQKEYEIRKSLFAEELIALGIENNNQPFTREDVIKGLNGVVHNIFNNNIRKAANELGFKETTFRYWVKGKNLPGLDAVAKMCLTFNISLKQFLNVNISSSDILYININVEEARQINNKYDHIFISKILQKVINDNLFISIKRLADYIGCDRTLLTKIYPEECKIIIEENKKFMSTKKIKRLKQKFDELDTAFFHTIKIDEFPSVRQLEKKLGKNFLKEKELRERFNNLRNLYL